MIEQISEFMHMGGYGTYVWLSYGILAGLLSFNIIYPKCQAKALLKTLNNTAS